MRHLVVFLFVAAMAGCASQVQRAGADNQRQVTRSINLSGFSPEYKQGFTAGCEAATGGSAKRPKGGGADALGWQDGFDYCKPRKPR